MVVNDSKGKAVRVLSNSGAFPKGTVGQLIDCQFVGYTSIRAYCIQTDQSIDGLVEGRKTEWYLDRDLENLDCIK